MDSKESDFLLKLKETFKLEADEHIRAVTTKLLDLEKSTPSKEQAEIIETIFREVHSLKGAARSVNLREIEAMCHPLESAFSALKHKEIALTPTLCDLLHRCVDFLSQLIATLGKEWTPSCKSQARELIKLLGNAVKGEVLPEVPVPPPAAGQPVSVVPEPAPAMRHEVALDVKPSLAETVRMPINKLEPLLYQAEEMIQARMTGVHRSRELAQISSHCIEWRTESARRKNHLPPMNTQSWKEYLAWNDSQVNLFLGRLSATSQALLQDQRGLKRMVDEHLESMKSVLMLPVSTLTESFPKFVRDLSHEQGKEVDLIVNGGDIEIDKRILEELKDPLIHLLRNAVDHGMEKMRDRVERKKSPRGTISLSFFPQENRQVEILLTDDGEGIDVDRVRASGIKVGAMTPKDAEMASSAAILLLIFQSGVSTSPIITDISGRGLGMTIVREKVEHLGGAVSVESELRIGTTFRLLLPMTLSTFRGVLVRTAERLFVLPTANVDRVARIFQKDIKTVENRETIALNGQVISTGKLSVALGLPSRQKERPSSGSGGSGGSDESGIPGAIFLIILRLDQQRMGFQVDEVLTEQQFLVKSLGKQLSRVRNISGATVLGTGEVVPVINVADLIQSAILATDRGEGPADEGKAVKKIGRILAVDDSITARTLVKSILETAGYKVSSAVDGAEAFALAKSEEFDLVVSDIDMPRMSGFELVTKIRADKKISELPVVLVTALDSRESRERGIDVGANAYIVKSNFDQSNLLEVIRKLL
jgi:two-component system chemotaxis sensor kinase CheA